MSKGKKLLFEVGGVQIYTESIYVIEDKEDLGAPSGLIKRGATKLPSDGVDESFQCAYKATSATTGVWDTGFHEFSPCYRGMEETVVNAKIETLKKNLVTPFERSVGVDGILAHNNDSFWATKNFKVFTGKSFDTTYPEDLLTLYFGLLNGELTPKGSEGDSKYNSSPYILVDKTQAVKKKDQKTSDLYKAIGIFEEFLKSDKPRLIAMLNYSGLVVSPTVSNDSFRSMFNEYLSMASGTNIGQFLRLVEMTSDEEGREIVEIYIRLKAAYGKGTKVSKNPNGVLHYEDTEIGPDLKSAASNIVKTSKLDHIKRDILLGEEVG